ncbi:MAG TPA: hypothetical protein VI564_00270 [Candidatus Nanoarchaeia archaeon]|nr:hypothetical protein [Candidatus Nanoarchaeia archaeon]
MAKQRTISKEVPLSEITLRRYEKPANLDERELARKVCLSLGLLQPGDSRDVIVDVLTVLLNAKKEKKTLTCGEICSLVISERKKQKLGGLGTAQSNISRQLRRLKDILIVEKRLNAYRISENSSLTEIFEEKIEKLLVASISSRIKEYLAKIDGL